MSYVNLHTHSTFSSLDGHLLIQDYMSRLQVLGHTHAALTDHGTMAGIPEFLEEAKRSGITPIIGMEAYVQPESRLRIHQQKDNYHLTLLAINRTGYDNLSRMATESSTNGFYYKPRVDWGLLEEHNEGIVVLSGCASGELAKAILADDEPRQLETIGFYMATFPGRYYLEFQDHGDWQDQQIINRRLVELAEYTGLPRVATNDAHFCVPDDFPAQQLLVAVNRSAKVNNVESGSPHNFIRDNELMASLFDRDMLRNSVDIASMVETYPIGDPRPRLPASPLERPGVPASSTLAMLARDGLERRLGMPFSEIPKPYLDRFESEMEVILELSKKLGTDFGRYLLIITDICNFARDRNIRFGPRGSAAGSVLNWALGFSEPDPIEHGLVFERFLNPYRREMPDVDIDFADNRRAEIYKYLFDTYGYVSKIGTCTMIGNKAAINDAAKAIMGKNPESEVLAKRMIRMIPHDPRPGGIPLWELVNDEIKGEQLREMAEDEPQVKEILTAALGIEGRQKTDGEHPGGVLVSDEPIDDLVPLTYTKDMRKEGTDDVPFKTHYEMQHLEKLGLLKIDILGLKTLSTLEMTLQKIDQIYGSTVVPDLWHLDWNDAKTWDLIKSGRTLGMFQIGSSGLGGACFQIQPDSINDLALTGAIYRPGPMQSLQTIVDRKHGREAIASIHPVVDPLLADTYGVPVYQEQIMGIARVFAGYDLGQADLLRKAMGKKIREKMAEEWVKFLAGAQANGHTEAEARTVWDFIEPFADYGFNKAHAVCYAYVAYQTGFLKANFPLEFYSSALTVEASSGGEESAQERIGSLIREATIRGFEIRPPSVNNPAVWFEIEDNAIRYGLAPIKGVSDKDAAKIVANAPYTGLEDFVMRCGVNRKALVDIAQVGALDCLDDRYSRRALTERVIPALADHRTKVKAKTKKNQETLFDTMQFAEKFDWSTIRNLKEWSPAKLLETEQFNLGMFTTPLPVPEVPITSCLDAKELEGWNVNMMGVLTRVNHTVAKKSGQSMAYATLLDETGQIDLVLFHRTYEEVKGHLREGSLVMASGRLQINRRAETNMIVDTLGVLDEPEPEPEVEAEVRRIVIGGTPREAIDEFGRIFTEASKYPGKIRCDVIYGTEVETLWISPLARIGNPSSSSIDSQMEATTASRS